MKTSSDGSTLKCHNILMATPMKPWRIPLINKPGTDVGAQMANSTNGLRRLNCRINSQFTPWRRRKVLKAESFSNSQFLGYNNWIIALTSPELKNSLWTRNENLSIHLERMQWVRLTNDLQLELFLANFPVLISSMPTWFIYLILILPNWTMTSIEFEKIYKSVYHSEKVF